MASLAQCKYRKNELQESLELRRYASCQNPGWEGYAKQYFHYASELGKEDEVLEFLRQRTEDQGRIKSSSWITLSQCYERVNDDKSAKQVALQALEKFPQDGELLVHIAMSCHSWGQGDEAESYLDRAKDSLSEEDWHASSGRLARNTGNRVKALRHYKRVTELNPTSFSAHQQYSDLLEEDYGEQHALNYIEGIVAQNGKNVPLLELFAMKLSRASDPKASDVLSKILSTEPNNLWALREQALVHEENGDLEKAVASGKLAIEKQPNQCENLGVLAGIYARNERKEKAVEGFKNAISLDADYTYAIVQWLSLLEKPDEKLEALGFYEEQLWAQEIVGGTILEFREIAYRYIEPEELLGKLRSFREKHTGEWGAWTAEKDQLLDMAKGQDALVVMNEAVEKFRYVPRIYVEQATVYKALGDNQKNISSLEKALELSPSWDWVARELADAYEFEGEHVKAEDVLKKAIQWSPLNPANGGYLAGLQVRLNKKDEAFDILAKTVKTSPHYDWGWRKISRLANENGRADDVIKMLGEHHESRAEFPLWQESCFNVYDILDKQDEALKFCDETLEKSPRNVEMHDSKSYLLARIGQVDEALSATEPEVFGEDIPPMLISRKALIYNEFIDPRKAIEVMEGLYQVQPDWAPAPMHLSRWYYNYGEDDKAEKYTKDWLRLAPKSHLALGQLGTLVEAKKKFKEASEYYKKAFQLNPEYSYAGYRAFELTLEHGRLDNVPQIIQLTRHYGRETESIEMELRYENAKGDKKRAFELFDVLMRRDDLVIEEIGSAEKLFPKHGAKRIVDIVEKGEAKSEALLQAWLWGRSGFMKCASQIVKLPYPREMKLPLWKDLIAWLNNMDDDEGCLKKLYLKHYQEFNEDIQCLASLQLACVSFFEYDIGCK